MSLGIREEQKCSSMPRRGENTGCGIRQTWAQLGLCLIRTSGSLLQTAKQLNEKVWAKFWVCNTQHSINGNHHQIFLELSSQRVQT